MLKSRRLRGVLTLGLTALTIAVGSVCVGSEANAESDVSDSASRTFVYTIANPDGPNAIAAYERNPETGELILLGAYPTGGRGSGRLIDSQGPLVASADGTLLYAINPGSEDISIMATKADGSLEPVGAPVPTRGVAPASLALGSNYLFVANKGDAANPPNYSSFRVESDGTLTRIKRRIILSIGDNPTHVLLNREGTMLIGVRLGSGGIDSFFVSSRGKLFQSATLNNQRGPFAAAFNPQAAEQMLVADARLPGAVSYGVSSNGLLSAGGAVSNAPERAACWIVVHPDGLRAWVSNTGTNSLSLYTIGAGGALSLAGTHSTAVYGRTPFEIALDSNSGFLYQLNIGGGRPNIHALRLTGSTTDAGLVDIGAMDLPAGSSPIGLVVVARPIL